VTHFGRERNDAGYYRGYVGAGGELATIIRNIDEKTKKSINGDEGGTWSPSSPIEIGGAGVIVGGPWVMSGAGVTVTTDTDKPITFGRGDAADYFALDPAHAGASPTVYSAFRVASSALKSDEPYLSGGRLLSAAVGSRFATPLRVLSGAPSIATVTVTFRVNETHMDVPQVLPRMRVVAVASDGTVIPLRAPDATTDLEGFQYFPTPASGAAWTAGGADQAWLYTCNVAHVVDTGEFLYFAELVDESGADSWTVAGNLFIGAAVTFAPISIFDGRD
jgi:hypothetical protein